VYELEKNAYLLFMGRIVPEKGLGYLIKAYKNVVTEKKLVIAGGSSDTDKFMSKLKELAGDDERIIFTGFVRGEVYESLFSNAYVYVLYSDLEGMPLSLLEAMSYGNCCLVSDVPECADVVKEHGVIIPRSNVEDLTGGLQRLIDEPALVDQYKETAVDYICRKYNWDDTVRDTLALYRK
jgi:glycosyltransferase involved in cell wall biosynthesis